MGRRRGVRRVLEGGLGGDRGGGVGGRGGGDGKSGHVVGPSVETLDIRDQSRRGRGAECGRSFLHVSKEQLVKMKQVMVKFAKFVGPGFMVRNLPPLHQCQNPNHKCQKLDFIYTNAGL